MTYLRHSLRPCMLALVWLASPPAFAQSKAPPATTPAAAPATPAAPAAPAASAAPAVEPPAAAPASEAPPTPVTAPEAPSGCFPSCRDGYVCYVNQCISACNPPCARDEHCTASGQCERQPATTPPLAVPAEPAEPAEDPGYRRHDGFMLRLSAGAGGGGLHFDGDGHWGGAGFFAFDIGGSPVENFVVHFRMSHYAFANNDVSLLWDYVGVSTWGLGLTWYFMPFDIYLTASLAFANINLVRTGRFDDVSSDGGFGTGLDVGKEWWVSKSWGLGLAARVVYVTTDIYSSTGLGVVFSATYQ